MSFQRKLLAVFSLTVFFSVAAVTAVGLAGSAARAEDWAQTAASASAHKGDK